MAFRVPLSALMSTRNGPLLYSYLVLVAGVLTVIVGASTLDLLLFAVGSLLVTAGVALVRWRLRKDFPAYAPRGRP